jgi:hypothetical protein
MLVSYFLFHYITSLHYFSIISIFMFQHHTTFVIEFLFSAECKIPLLYNEKTTVVSDLHQL